MALFHFMLLPAAVLASPVAPRLTLTFVAVYVLLAQSSRLRR